MKSFWWIIPLLVSPNLVHADQERQRRQRFQQEEKRRNNNSSSDDDDDENGYGQKFQEFMEGEQAQNVMQYGKPRHLLEGVMNTIKVTGPALLVGTLSFIGLPLLGIFGQLSSNNNSNNFDDSTIGNPKMRRFGTIVGAIMVGAIVGGSCWIAGIVFGLWQLVMGAIATPKTLWAWTQGHVYWKDYSWQPYDLTAHAEELQNPSASSRNGKNIQDDSLYKVLDVKPAASAKEIKRAYYKLAKENHPDKHPDKEEEFLKIHTAYETLYNEDSRKSYDEWGTSSLDEGMPVDPSIFFDVLFGVSPELEVWIGDLSVKSFVTNLCQLMFVAQESDGDKNQEILEGLIRTLFDGSHRTESRQVDIGLYLQDFTRAFVEGEISKAEFEQLCDEHASQVFESTPFPVLFMETIGSELYWQGKGSVQTPLDLPFSVMAWAREKGSGATSFGWYGYQLIQLGRDSNERMEKVGETIRAEHKKSKLNEEELQKLIRNQVLLDILPTLMDSVWRYNQRDIAATLKGACWKLLHDRSSKHLHRRQAKALVISGTSFLKIVKNGKYVCDGDGECDGDGDVNGTGREFMDDANRLEVAIQMATNKVRVFSQSMGRNGCHIHIMWAYVERWVFSVFVVVVSYPCSYVES
jgi:hypothetical protein